MFRIIHYASLVVFAHASATSVFAEDTILFNGKNLDGWTFEVREDEDNPKPVDEVWIVRDGLLISTGACNGFLKHESEFENYVLTLECRSMQLNGNGVAVGGAGSVFVHTSDEEGSFHYPKSVEVRAFNDTGSVFLRDVFEPFSEKTWAFPASDAAEDAEKEMGEWNHLKLICRGNQLTVFLNGTPVNQVEGLNRTKGAIALDSQTGFFQAPSFYRNLVVQPLSAETAGEETTAAARLAEFKMLAAKKNAAQEAARLAEEKQEKMKAEGFARQWAKIDVAQEIDFSTDARKLPFPADATDLAFRPAFSDIELMSKSSLADLSVFYRTEMAKRGWEEADKERDEDSIEVTFKHGEAEVELSLDQKSKGVEVSLDCRGLSFEGTNDPAGLAALGLPQPKAYVFLQQEIELPADARDLEFDSGDRCLFKSGLGLQAAFDQIGQQLRSKGYRETRRPIVNDNRRYTEFAKGRVKISVNMFTHETGCRAVLTLEED